MVEYLAMLTSMNGKATKKAIDARRKQMNHEVNKKEETFNKIDKKGENAYGIHVNTSFLDTIKQYGGEEAFNLMQGEVLETSKQIEDEDGDFIAYVKKIAAEEDVIRAEELAASKNQEDIIEF